MLNGPSSAQFTFFIFHLVCSKSFTSHQGLVFSSCLYCLAEFRTYLYSCLFFGVWAAKSSCISRSYDDLRILMQYS